MADLDSNSVISILKAIQRYFQAKLKPESKLENVMKEIAAFFKADSSVLYISVDENYLELFAGFNLDGTELSHIRYGENFIGEVASSLQVLSKDIENKESIIAVPLMQWDKVTGVILLRFYQKHHFFEQETDILKTIAMFLVSFLSSEEMALYKSSFAKLKGLSFKDRLKGVSLNKGYGLGYALVHKRRQAVKQMFTKDIQSELKALEVAREKMLQDLDQKLNESVLGAGEHTDILETYKMLAEDKGWYQKITSYVENGFAAEAAVEKVYENMFARLSMSSDIYLKERLNDLRDISDRLRSFLEKGTSKNIISQKDIVLIAQTMGPADLMDYDYGKIRALILEDGTSTMHVAIVAKALNIPVVAKIKGLYQDIKEDTLIGVDGEEGVVYINPSEEIKQKFSKFQQNQKDWRFELEKLKKYPTKTRDGIKISLSLNIGLDFDLEYIEPSGCDGVGLYRTELPFMSASKMLSTADQIKIYQKLLSKTKGKKVIFRSLDVGSDKLLPYWGNLKEENPAMGWRSIRITLDRRAILREQMQAFIKASSGRELDVMFPMISSFEEFQEAKETLMLEYQKQKKNGIKLPSKINAGLMIEVPSVIFELDEILKQADFISIGTNDLAQFVFASDRTNPRLIDRYDVLSVPFLKIMRHIIKKANEHHVLCSVCGEMGSQPIEAMALIGLGFRNFSASGSAFSSVKKMIRSLNVEEITDYLETLLESSNQNLRPQLSAYAYDHGIAI